VKKEVEKDASLSESIESGDGCFTLRRELKKACIDIEKKRK